MTESLARTARQVPRPDALPANPLRALLSPYTGLATIHLMTDAVVGAVTFAIMVTLLSLSASLLLVALLGVPIWVLTVHIARALTSFERARFRLTLGMDLPTPALPPRAPFLRYAWSLATSRVVWREIAYLLLLLPWGAVTAAVTWIGVVVPITLIGLPFYYSSLAAGAADLQILTVGDLQTALLAAVGGVLLLCLVTPGLIRALRLVDAELGRALLGSLGTDELAERVDALTTSRRQVVDSAQTERLRIERDLHDGAQQRLVALALTLGRAKSKLPADADARRLVDEAHDEAKMAIAELRDLTRGLQPPVLSDRGLDAALSALAARSPVPVTVDVEPGMRPSPTIEAIAYFVVAESLTNIAKHSGARQASVVVRRVADLLRVVVTDDGMGGADQAKGSGIAGISDRIAGVDGRLSITSPAGGPTILTVTLPCAS